MKRIKYLFVLFILISYSSQIYSQEITFYYDKIAEKLSYRPDGNQLIETLTRQIWNESLSNWENDSLYEYSYNQRCLVDTFISHKWRYGSVWGNEIKKTYSYNANDSLSLMKISNWMFSTWYENMQYSYSYSPPHQKLSRISIYNYVPEIWYLWIYYLYDYSSNNTLTEVTKYVSSTQIPNYYILTWSDQYYYDSTNVLIMKTGLDYGWRNEINDLYFYDSNGNNNENIRQEWNDTDSAWVNEYRYLYEYDINNVLLSVIYQDWELNSLDWVNVFRETYTYTPQNQIATMFKESWSQAAGWSNYALRTYFYDTNYNWTEKLTQLWDGSTWKDYYRHLATWQQPVSVSEEFSNPISFYLSQNYPNPFNPTTKIKFTIPASEIFLEGTGGGLVTLKVFDILGNEITTLVSEEKEPGIYEVEFDGMGLSSGIYIYQLKAERFVDTKKMILLR